jgi:hypothetical protein
MEVEKVMSASVCRLCPVLVLGLPAFSHPPPPPLKCPPGAPLCRLKYNYINALD